MKAVLQRADSASVVVDGQTVGSFEGEGLVVLLGITHTDGPQQVQTMVRKIAELRILADERSVSDANAPVMVISQFTLYGKTKKGRRPSWTEAAPGPVAQPLYEAVVQGLRERGLDVSTGIFGAMMKVSFTNDGPFTVLVDC